MVILYFLNRSASIINMNYFIDGSPIHDSNALMHVHIYTKKNIYTHVYAYVVGRLLLTYPIEILLSY